MSHIYSDVEREKDKYALPNTEVFYVDELTCNYNKQNLDHADEYTVVDPGWYWWNCYPGCLPDSAPVGPFDTEEEAIEDAQYY